MSTLSAGDIIADKYRVVRTIGEGGMGVVLEAEHLQLPRRVAVKVLHPEASATAVERFAREARAVAQIHSEHVCRVLDVGELPGGAPFMVMELLVGSDFQQLLQAQGALPFAQTIDHVLEACEALAEAHILGIVHRDLKPGNLFLASRPGNTKITKLLDFGISKPNPLARGVGPTLTSSSSLLGSPRFMSPEQLTANHTVDARSDIWALGAMLHELLGGGRAFEGGSIAEVCVAIIQEDPEPLERIRPDIPPPLAAVIRRCLSKEAEDRYANLAELSQALVPFGTAAARASAARIASLFDAGQDGDDPAAASLGGTVVMGSAPASPLAAANAPAPAIPEPTGAMAHLPAAPAPPHGSTQQAGTPASLVGEAAGSGAYPVAQPTPAPMVPQGPPTGALAAPPARKSSPWLLVIGALIIFALGAGGAVLLVLPGSGDPQPAASSVTTATTSIEVADSAPSGSSTGDAPASASGTAAAQPAASSGSTASASEKTAPTRAPHGGKVVKPRVNCSGDNAYVRDQHGGLKVRPECLK